MAEDIKPAAETTPPEAVSAKRSRPQVEIPEKGKVKVTAQVCPGLVTATFKEVPVNVSYPRNTAPPEIGKSVDVVFGEVVPNHAVEARFIPED